jgi:hypothetical protein
VREDVLAQWVSFERARDVYGVVFVEELTHDGLAVDAEATARRREELRT